jgi:thiol-disulfide isomerase/thioredoxin
VKFIFILIGLATLCLGQNSSDSLKLEEGYEAPSFCLPSFGQDYIYLRDYCGEQLRKPWLKEKYVVVISFFATWCKPCIAEIPHLEKIKEEFKDKPIKFFLINVGEDKDKIREFLANHKINLTILFDRFQKTAEKYDALTLPRLYVIDKNGIIRKSQRGFADAQIFENELRSLISELLR